MWHNRSLLMGTTLCTWLANVVEIQNNQQSLSHQVSQEPSMPQALKMETWLFLWGTLIALIYCILHQQLTHMDGGMHVCTGLNSSVSMNPQIHMLRILLSQRGIPSPEGVIKFRHCSKDGKLSRRMLITGESVYTITLSLYHCHYQWMPSTADCYHQFCAAAIQVPVKTIQRQIKGGGACKHPEQTPPPWLHATALCLQKDLAAMLICSQSLSTSIHMCH